VGDEKTPYVKDLKAKLKAKYNSLNTLNEKESLAAT
jgi:hypothetical protein